MKKTDSIQKLSSDPGDITSSRMRIALVAPHSSSKNGIGNYTTRLTGELRLHCPQCSIVNLADFLSQETKTGTNSGDWHGREFPPHWPDIFLEAIDSVHTQLVHIQHGLYLDHGRGMARFLAELHSRRIPCVITLHGVWPPTAFRRWPIRFYRLLTEHVQQVIVHQKNGSLGVLEEQGVPTDRVKVIPHGTWTREEITPAQYPNISNTDGRRVVLFAGNIFRRKGLHILLKAFPAVVRKVPGVCLVVVGDERSNNILDRLYRFQLHTLMRSGLNEGWLIRRPEYVPEPELWARIMAAEVVVFPYMRRYGSASGVFHRVLAVGRPAVCSNIPTFAEAFDAWGESLPGLFPPPGDVDALSHTLINLLSDEPLRRRALEASTNLGVKTSWPLVAREHLQLYWSLLQQGPLS
jgi:glycosyltransferase involved in cell wall biosynthesis